MVGRKKISLESLTRITTAEFRIKDVDDKLHKSSTKIIRGRKNSSKKLNE